MFLLHSPLGCCSTGGICQKFCMDHIPGKFHPTPNFRVSSIELYNFLLLYARFIEIQSRDITRSDLDDLSLQHETLGLLDVRGTRVCSERLRWSRTVPSSVERPAALSPARATGGSAVVRRLVLDPGGRLGCARWPGIDVRVRTEEPTTVRAAHFT